jgi:hypothetical protein
MRRRQFIVGTGLAAASALAGCTGGDQSPPPRKSNVIETVDVSDGALSIDVDGDTWVVSRYDSTDDGQQALADPDSVGALSPVGAASAKGKGGGGGRGATGRGTGGYSSAPRTHHGRAWYHGGDYADDWYENHGDEVQKYGVVVAALGVAYLGSDAQFQSDKPGPGRVPWDETFSNPSDAETYSIDRQGWYRVGAHIRGEDVNHDFRWEAVDVEVDRSGSSYEIAEKWKVSPRI